jgi:predicted dehydrogenase
MMHDRLGVAVIGLGMVAATHARALQDLKSVLEVRGVYARGAERRAEFARAFGFPPSDDAMALIARPEVDLVLILTPPNAREDYVRAACASGKHVLLEKPIERTSAAAERIVSMCSEAGVKLGVTFQHRFREASTALKRLVDEGALGTLVAGQVVVPWWRDQSYYDVPGRGTFARDGGGVLISQAIHTLDLLVWLVGPPTDVAGMAATTRRQRMEGEGLGGGAVGGSGGGADPMAFTHDWHRLVIEDFATAVREGREPIASGASALKVHRLLDARLASASQGRRTAVQDGGQG